MPHDAATAVVLAILQAGLAGAQALDGAAHGAVLLVTAHCFDGGAVGVHEQGEVPHHVQQVAGGEQAGYQALLLGQLCLAQGLAHGVFSQRRHGLPGCVVLEGGSHGAHAGLVKAGGHQQLVGVKEGLVAFVVVHLATGLALVAVAAQLVHGLGQRLGH